MSKNNIFLIGPTGAGKSTVGKYLAKALRYKFYDCIEEIEKRAGVNKDWIKDIEGETGLLKREEKIITELANQQKIVVATTEDAVLSLKNRELLRNHGAVIFLKTTQTTCATLYQATADMAVDTTGLAVPEVVNKVLCIKAIIGSKSLIKNESSLL
jgi:shikimate kinase